MPAYIGDKEIVGAALGDKELVNIYLGDKEIWGGSKIIELGTGQTWDIKTLYPKIYADLTADNFFFRSVNTVYASMSGRVRPGDGSVTDGFSGQLVKTYNASTGVLSAYGRCNSYRSNVTMCLVLKPEKLIFLGTGYSFSLVNHDDYRSFTNDNFLISGAAKVTGCYNVYYDSGYTYDYSGTATLSFPKNYDSGAGSLSTSMSLVSRGDFINKSDSSGLTMYLNPKI